MTPDYRGCRPEGLLVSLRGKSTWDDAVEESTIYDRILKGNSTEVDIILKHMLYPATLYDVLIQPYNSHGKGELMTKEKFILSPNGSKLLMQNESQRIKKI